MYTFLSDKKKRPLILSVGLLIIVMILSIIYIIVSRLQVDQSCMAYVYQDGALIDTIDLNQVTETYTFQVTGDNGTENTVEVRHGEIGIIEATCPDHLCIDTGFIHNSTMPVVCLPNKLLIEIKNTNATEDEVDGYSY